jgi:hypothetical protein
MFYDVIALTLEGNETLEVTRHHRLFSADRRDWVRARDIQDGEALQTHGAAPVTRALQASDFGAQASVEVVQGTLSVQENVATVGIKYIQGQLGNPITALNALKETARQAGATTLRIEATIANARLLPVLTRILGPATPGVAGGAQDVWVLGL